MVLFLSSRTTVADFYRTCITAVHSPVPSPCVPNAAESHFCLCAWVGRAVKQGPAASELSMLCSCHCPQQVLEMSSPLHRALEGTRWCHWHEFQRGAQMVLQDVRAVRSSLLNAVLCWSRRRWEVGTASPTKWTIFMDPCRQSLLKWSRTAFYFDWKHCYE